MWKPEEIIINTEVRDDAVTRRVVKACPDVPVQYVTSSRPDAVVAASKVLGGAEGLLETILAGKEVLFVAPPGHAVDVFKMPDDRMVCPHFERVKLAANGCFYRCDWCYLKLTYRAAFPFITVRAGLDTIKAQLARRLQKDTAPVMFNSGEFADSLALEHLTGAMGEMIPWFAQTRDGYLFLLTKSDSVDSILDLDHNEHTVVAWSMNAPSVSQRFELGAPTFKRRLAAAVKVERAGYPVRIRLDPIVPVEGWREEYAETIRRIFDVLSPDGITLGTLRFEPAFWKMRHSVLATGDALLSLMNSMQPMFEPKVIGGKNKVGKYSFSEAERVDVFSFAINEIRKYTDCTIALCKESAAVWDAVGLPLSRCACVCQLFPKNMTEARRAAEVTITERRPRSRRRASTS